MKDLNIMSLDMEYNQPSKSIIQIGIAVGNLKSGEIFFRGCWHIAVDEKVSEFITVLTGITTEDILVGYNLNEVYMFLSAIHTKYKCFRNPLTWGGGDSEDLRKALDLYNASGSLCHERYIFGRRWIDAKTLFVSRCLARDEKTQSGLAKSLTRLGLNFEGRKHNAMDDAVNTFRIYRKLLEELE